MGQRIAIYFAWDRIAETTAPLGDLNNRFPALHEVRRTFWPRYEALEHAEGGQDIEGFLQAIFLQNFARFGDQVAAHTGRPLRRVQRRAPDGETLLDAGLLATIDTLIVISFDAQHTGQTATAAEVAAVRSFLAKPENLLFVCPHHDIGDTEGLDGEAAAARQAAEFRHHGDIALPGQQRVGGFGRSLMAGLGVPIRNRFGLRPAPGARGDGSALLHGATDRFGLLSGVEHLNLHPHLPHYERHGAAIEALEVLARQVVHPDAPPHPEAPGDGAFDAMLQARPEAGLGRLVVCDATQWTSAFGGLQGLQAFWKNVITA
jgi:hypothetical protein